MILKQLSRVVPSFIWKQTAIRVNSVSHNTVLGRQLASPRKYVHFLSFELMKGHPQSFESPLLVYSL